MRSPLARPSPKTRPIIWLPAACVFLWGEITRNEILLDAARRDEHQKIPLTASELARRVGLDTSDGREAARALVARGIWRRESDEFVPRARKELAGSYPDAGDFDVPILAESRRRSGRVVSRRSSSELTSPSVGFRGRASMAWRFPRESPAEGSRSSSEGLNKAGDGHSSRPAKRV